MFGTIVLHIPTHQNYHLNNNFGNILCSYFALHFLQKSKQAMLTKSFKAFFSANKTHFEKLLCELNSHHYEVSKYTNGSLLPQQTRLPLCIWSASPKLPASEITEPCPTVKCYPCWIIVTRIAEYTYYTMKSAIQWRIRLFRHK